MNLANLQALILMATTKTVTFIKHQRPSSRRTHLAHDLLMLSLYLPLVFMIAIGPLIANTDHFHQTVSHGPAAQIHHHVDAIAQADPLELGLHHVHLTDSLQLNAIVAGENPIHHHANRDIKKNNPLVNYTDVFLDGLLRPPRV